MHIEFTLAQADDAKVIAQLVMNLTEEISLRTHAKHFSIDFSGTYQRCYTLLRDQHYAAMLAYSGDKVIAVATMTESYALYAGGKVGIIPEFYVVPDYRSSGVGAQLIEQLKCYGRQHDWSCMELCTPPLPEFQRTLDFYQSNGFDAVGGRKMRQSLAL